MAVTYATGLEVQQWQTDGLGALTGTAAYSATQVRTGAASIRCNPASSASGYIQPGNPTGGWDHFGIYIASLPSLTRRILNTPAADTPALRLTSTGALECWINNSLIGTTPALSTSTWHWIGLRNNTGTSVEWMQVDGANAGFTATATMSYGWNTLGFSSNEASAVDVYFDDLIVDGAGFLVSSKVDIAFPIADNPRGNATGGAGGTTNLWDAVNNTPPAGAATDTDTTNIKCPASTVVGYYCNVETYTTLGIGASDTVLAVQSIVRHGEDASSGTKNITVGAVTNPTIAGAAVTAGVDTGAHGAETGNWQTKFGTLTTSPSVTLGTSPTIGIVRASETRVACIDFMGLLVVWTPVPGFIHSQALVIT